MADKSALVLFSGGQDSAVCLAWALARYARVETLAFDYGQRHAVELAQRGAVLDGFRARFPDWAARLGADHSLALPELGRLSETALTRETEITLTEAGLPSTFVPGRNLLFLVYAGALAYRRGIRTLVGGMCETDYSGYPDCRNETLQTLARAMSLGMDVELSVETPLMWIDKAGTWALAHALGGDALVDLIVEETHTCYLGDRSRRHAWGAGCGTCPACALRAKGWDAWKGDTINDETKAATPR
ncbi:MAG TPA: 7-cyano-7-deazaguanine synthase QueC [Hyphomicrobium sp.]|nr:7-cyano-7-deazaguanine synthase QueC [Hyphomicrobium sp.]